MVKYDKTMFDLKSDAEWHAEIIAKFRTTLVLNDVSAPLADKLTEIYARKFIDSLSRPIYNITHPDPLVSKGMSLGE